MRNAQSEPAPDIHDVTIADVAYRGAGVARLDGWVVFVPGALAGERVRVRIARRRKQYGEGTIVDILDPSPLRVVPVCPLAGVCPGCTYQAVDYAEEVRLKQSQLAHFLTRAAGVPAESILPPLASPQALHYRNKLVLHGDLVAGNPVLGYFSADNTTLLDVPSCPLAHPAINARLAELRADVAFMGSVRPRMSLTIRHTAHDGVRHWVDRPPPDAPWLQEETPLGDLAVPQHSFFQVNPGAAALLVQHAQAWIRDLAPRNVIDLYCGVGVFALAAAQAGVSATVGVDRDAIAIAAARRNAVALGVSATFVCGAAEADVRAVLSHAEPQGTLLIVDPPRTGLTRPLIADVARFRPAWLLYISCAADTLARDLKLLGPAGYNVVRAQLVDMFPRTPYFETMTLLKRAAGS
ncbi:MAG: TRAM domain-containing protein [Verrucomicrobia bacterium]|nr:TRAM domain-containing protein [Verrucomicrobiota bacterium]